MNENEIRCPLTRSRANRRFHDESEARSHIDTQMRCVRPPCPRCGGAALWPRYTVPAKGLCRQCGWFGYRQHTIFARSHLPLRLWLAAIRLMTASEGQITAAELHRALRLRSFHTAQRPAAKVRAEWSVWADTQRRADEARDWQATERFTGRHEDIFSEWEMPEAFDYDEERDVDEHDRLGDAQLNDVSLDPMGLPIDLSESAAVISVQPLFDYEHTRLKRFAFLNRSPDFEDDRREDWMTCADAAEFLDLPIARVIALSRIGSASRFSSVRADVVMFRRRVLAQGRDLFRRFAEGLSEEICRPSPFPLPPRLWASLRELPLPAGKGRAATSELHRYLNAFWKLIDEWYGSHEVAGAKWRRSQRGLQCALLETTELSRDRCNRYARAIELVVNAASYDGSPRAFAEVLGTNGGLDRAIRSAGKKSERKGALRHPDRSQS